MITFPNAKINLGLHIVERRPDGYHNLETVFYPLLSLQDALEVVPQDNYQPGDDKIKFHQSGLQIAGDVESNLVVRAYRLLDGEFDLPPVEAYLIKKIPSGAGMGGGSSDAAFMLRMLNELFRLGLSREALEERAARLGADCAFFIANAPTFAEGIGNLFSPIELNLDDYEIRIEKPDVFVSTRDAFARIHPCRPEHDLREIIKRPVKEWKSVLKNDFEKSVFPRFPEIAAAKQRMYDAGAVYAAMSGSGSAVFGIFKK